MTHPSTLPFFHPSRLVRVSGLLLSLAVSLCAATPDETASKILGQSSAPGGICAVVGANDASLAVAIAKQGAFVVHALCPDQASCASARKAIRAHGMYGPVSAAVLTEKTLPYADNLINILVAAGPVPQEETARVLAPLGAAFDANGKPLFQKPWPKDIDEWTHYLHGPDGNAVARDRVVGPPARYQWVSGPLWQRSHESDSSISVIVTARGRLFSIVDEAPISLVGPHPLPDKWFLKAQDAFNGVTLWKVPIRRWGWREWKPSWFNTRPGEVPLNLQKRLVAAGDRLYVTLGFRAPVSQIDARTGNILKTYPDTERANEVLYLDGTLVCSVLEGDGARIVAVDAESGRKLWASERIYGGSTVDYIKWKAMRGATKPAKLDPAPNIATDGTVVALLDGKALACIDASTGKHKWTTAFPSDAADLTAGGIKSLGNLWVGTTIVSNGVVIDASPNKLAGFDADTGKLLWEQPKKYIQHLWYEWKDVFVVDGVVYTWGADLLREPIGPKSGRKQFSLFPSTLRGYDVKSGTLKKTIALGPLFKTHHHHRCYRNKATVRYILASRRGSEFVSLEGEPHTLHNWVRGTCHMGMMPANGLQYAPPHPCQCYIEEKLTGMNALSASQAPLPVPTASRLAKGPAYQTLRSPKPVSVASAWPAFRANGMRTGSADTVIPSDATRLWRVKAGARVTPPIVAGKRVFAALPDEHCVVCLDAATGEKLWEFVAGGRIDSPPTWDAGKLLFGSADGRVYCLRATDGALKWAFRAAPAERLIGAFGQLESAWPVHGSVLVHKGVAYVSAGRSSELDGGIALVALDAATGEIMHENKLDGPHYTADTIQENYLLPEGALSDILQLDGDVLHMRTRTFDLALKEQRGKPELLPRAGFLEDSYFKRIPWTLGGQYARLIVRDAERAYYVRMFDSLEGLNPNVYFTPGKQGYLLFARALTRGESKGWQERIPIRVRAMALAKGSLWVAGLPDVVDPKDPLGSFEGRLGGKLLAVDTATGERLAEHALASSPVFNGAAAADGRLYLASEDGSITCFGK